MTWALLAILAQDDVRPILERACVKCHGEKRPKGGLNLEAGAPGARQLWALARKVRDGEMPPKDPRLSDADKKAVVSWAEKALDALPADDPGRTPIRRLTRVEYNNTVRDLVGVTTRPADRFPPDGGGGEGFDNNAATLYVPPLLLEKVLEAAGEAAAKAPADRLLTDKDPRRLLERLATRAYRRPAGKTEVDGLLEDFTRNGSGEKAVRSTIKTLLVSPKFLYRIELEREKIGPVTPFEMASRLSYFLWASMPDEELFRLATDAKLTDPAVLKAQVARMLRDPKARAFAEEFAIQWLGIGELSTLIKPDASLFPEWTPSLRDAAKTEAVEFFLAVLKDDRPITDLIDADYVVVNEELARHYGLPGVTGPQFRRVALPDRRRGGVLGMAAVLTLTSFSRRTSSVLRGKWVLEEILGSVAPPPPPDVVATLGEEDKVRNGKTFRQQLEAHRSKPECAGCHSRLDPPGFGLETFDAIGRWRDKIDGRPVDATGVLPDGRTFNGPIELKKILVERRSEFARLLVEKMLSYALGRGLEDADVPAARHILADVEKREFRTSALIEGVVLSYPFTHRRP